MVKISRRLRASVGMDAINGDSFERSICAKQMTEAADLIESLERERDALRALVMRVAEGKCICTMSQRLTGDGCEVCNPQMAIEIARENAEGADHDI